MEANNIPTGRNGGSTSAMKEEEEDRRLPRVSTFDSGQGLPYAPVNWPRAGDIWGWRVGGRFTRDGIFTDRALIVPKRLVKLIPRRSTRLNLNSKAAVQRFLRSEFPHADIGKFFDSFTWKIPVKPQFLKQVNRPRKFPKLETKEIGGGMTQQKLVFYGQRSRRSTRKLAQFTTKCTDTMIELSSDSTMISDTDSPTHSPTATSHSLEKFKAEAIPENFDDCLNYLDDILAQPPHGFGCSSSSSRSNEDTTQVRTRLSEILGMDLRAVLSSRGLVTEMVTLSDKLQRDSSLSAPEMSILKLIEKIPTSMKVKADADAEMEADVVQATSSKTNYSETRKKAAQLRSEIISSSMDMQQIDDEISRLQFLKSEKIAALEKTKKEMDEVTSKQKTVVSSLPKLVREIHLARLQRPEWELAKKLAADQEARILAEFAPLKGFSF